MLDLEDTGGLSSSALQTWVKAFVNRIYDRTGVRASSTFPSFWSNKMGNSTWFANNGYDVLWIAHWTTASSPSVPAENWGGKSWTFWRTRRTAPCGISGRVDLDRYNGTDLTKVLIPMEPHSSRVRGRLPRTVAGPTSARAADDGRARIPTTAWGPHMNNPLRALRGTLLVSLAILVAACATTTTSPSPTPSAVATAAASAAGGGARIADEPH